MKTSNLDEMQEQKLLKIEHNGYWLAWTGLLAAILIQGCLGGTFRELIGELVVLLLICLYLVVDCLRNGIWDRRLKANWKTNLIGSLIAGTVVGVFSLLRSTAYGYVDSALDAVLITLLPGGFTFALTFAAMTLSTWLYRRRRQKLDQE